MTSTVPHNLIPTVPELKDLERLWKYGIFTDLNCHQIATIKTFNATQQTAVAECVYKRTYFDPNPATGVYGPTLVDYPLLADCPVICLGGGTGALTFPIAAGDECLVLFNDRDIDNWFAGAKGGPVATDRAHSFSDGIILVGLRSAANVIPTYSTNSIDLRNKAGTRKVSIYEDKITAELLPSQITLEINEAGKIKITNTTGEFVALLVKLLEDIQNATVATSLGPQNLQMPTFATDLTNFESFKG